MAFDKGHALLIGVGTYENAPNLNVPVTTADAEQVAMVLGDPQYCGYPSGQITLLRDDQATRTGILQALENLAASASKDDTVFLFYSGHGHYGEDGTYYLTTNDMQLTADRKVADGTAVRQDELLAALQRVQAERVLLIFNACHSGEISPTLAADDPPFTGAPLPVPTAAALLSTGSGRLIVTACRENQYAYVGAGQNTIFVAALVQGLRGQGVSSRRGFISAFDLYSEVYDTVTKTVQQTIPQATRDRYSATQEPELTVLKGVGPFAVALYQGASATLGEFSAPSQLPAGTAAREVEASKSRMLLQQIQSGGVNLGAGNTFGSLGDLVAGDKVMGDKVMGDKRTINAGSDSEKQQLRELLVELNAVLQQAPAASKDDAETVASFAQSLVDLAAKPQPNRSMVQITGTGLKQAAENIAGVLPAVLTIATQIVGLVGRLVP